MTISQYQQRVNAQNLAAQHPLVRAEAKEILDELRKIEQSLYWAIDGLETDGAMWALSLIEHAHALLDRAHEFRVELRANPPPKTGDNPKSSLQSTR